MKNGVQKKVYGLRVADYAVSSVEPKKLDTLMKAFLSILLRCSSEAFEIMLSSSIQCLKMILLI